MDSNHQGFPPLRCRGNQHPPQDVLTLVRCSDVRSTLSVRSMATSRGPTKPPAAPAAPSRNVEAPPGVTTPAPAPAVPSAPDGQGADECLRQRTMDPVAGGMLECQHFTSGSLMPAGMPRAPGLSSGDYAVRFGSVGGRLLMTLRIPCAAYAVRVSIAGDTITPDPGTLESVVGTCTFPWDPGAGADGTVHSGPASDCAAGKRHRAAQPGVGGHPLPHPL